MRYLLLIPLLLGGCATRGQVETNTCHIVDILARENITLEALETLFAERERYAAEKALAVTTEDIEKPSHDTRWGKCEEHGEWWIYDSSQGVHRIGWIPNPAWGLMTPRERWVKPSRFAIAGVTLICPRGHYIDREIEEPKESHEEE